MLDLATVDTVCTTYVILEYDGGELKVTVPFSQITSMSQCSDGTIFLHQKEQRTCRCGHSPELVKEYHAYLARKG